MNADRNLHLIPVACGLGAPDSRCADGPESLLECGLEARLARAARRVTVEPVLRPRTEATGDAVGRVAEVCARMAQRVHDAVAAGGATLALVGDHSCAVGTWSGASRALATRGRLGLIWIDAHLDSHTLETTPSGALHGMPLAALLGFGDPVLTGCAGAGPKLAPENVCVIGTRSFETEEAALLIRLGVRVFDMDEIGRRGLAEVMAEALDIARNGTAGFGVSIDLDALDPYDAPGVGTPEPGGLRGAELLAALARLAHHPELIAVELAEYNPHRDVRGVTARLAIELIETLLSGVDAAALTALEQQYGAAIYQPLPVVLVRGEGVYVWDHAGKRYLDMMSAYSAVSHGHAHPRLVQALTEQASKLAICSRAFHSDKLGAFLKRACELTGMDMALPMNTGAEAVETALKAARKWAYKVKGVPADKAEIIACRGNFHGRSIAIVGMSSEPQYRDEFGPYPPGFKLIPYGDAQALADAITPETAAFIVEPVQGEAGIVVPPAGYLAECARICRERAVLLILDEVQTGLGRTGRLFAFQHDDLQPDGLVLGKALGGGLLPAAAFVARREVTRVLKPGDHGSTFGGNPLAAAVALTAIDVLFDERLAENAALIGNYMIEQLRAIASPLVREVRGKGLLIGVDLVCERASARAACEKLLAAGILTKDTHETVLRFAPPLIVTRAQIDWALEQIRQVLDDLGRDQRRAA